MGHTSFAVLFVVRLLPVLLLLATLSSPKCFAQASPTLGKSAEISTFAGALSLSPAYGGNRDFGGTVGIDFTRYFNTSRFAPSLEFRANMAHGPVVNEHSYLLGLKEQVQVGQRFYPYVDALWGRGNIHFNQNSGYVGDNSGTIDFGAGLDIDIMPRFQAKIDWQTQRWKLDPAHDAFHPNGVVFGIVYRIPFRRFVSQQDLR